MKKLLFLCILVIFLSGCVAETNTLHPTEAASLVNTDPVVPTATLSSEMQTILANISRQWSESPHAQIEQAVNCTNCHLSYDGMATREIAWWDEENGKYETISAGSDLCLKCHDDFADAEFAHAKKDCLDCHDAHRVVASCLDCHDHVSRVNSVQVLATPIDGHPSGMSGECDGSGCQSVATQVAEITQTSFSIHDASHANVTCEACHAAEDFEVGPMVEGNIWVLWRTMKIDGKTIMVPYSSHNLQYKVDCVRCHFDGNPWNLPLVKN